MARIPDRYFSDRRALVRGGAAGTLEVRYAIPVGSYAEVINGEMLNGDTVSRVGFCGYYKAGSRMFYLTWVAAIGAGAQANILSTLAGSPVYGPRDCPVLGGHEIRSNVAAVAAGEDVTFTMFMRITGEPPVVTEVNA